MVDGAGFQRNGISASRIRTGNGKGNIMDDGMNERLDDSVDAGWCIVLAGIRSHLVTRLDSSK